MTLVYEVDAVWLHSNACSFYQGFDEL
jgi:hypothetical protein